MPIEIKELVIRATVDQQGATHSKVGTQAGNNRNQVNGLNMRMEELIRMIREKNER